MLFQILLEFLEGLISKIHFFIHLDFKLFEKILSNNKIYFDLEI